MDYSCKQIIHTMYHEMCTCTKGHNIITQDAPACAQGYVRSEVHMLVKVYGFLHDCGNSHKYKEMCMYIHVYI